MSALPSRRDVVAAAARLAGYAVRTPLLNFEALDKAVGARVFVKPEVLQRTGSFKFRGAYNRIAQIAPDARRNGVVAWSSGNHAQGVAAAAALFDMPARIVMPADAPVIKLERTRALGAEVITYDRQREDREAIGRALAAKHGATIVPPYDDPYIIAGQGTVGLEIAEDAARLGVTLDALYVPVSGGGLVAGAALAFGDAPPGTKIYAVEPDGFDDHGRSLASGKREKSAAVDGSICDALMAPTPGELTFAINAARLAGAVAVSDDEAMDAMRFAFVEMKLVVEPGGAVALAALLSGKAEVQGQSVGLILSGGNVDPDFFRDVLGSSFSA